MGISILGLVACALVSAEPAPVSVDQAARLYRLEIYQTFRTDRREYEARRETGDKILTAFRKLESPDAQREEVLQWFSTARDASLAGQVRTLPQLPAFIDGQVATLPQPKTHPVTTSEKLKLETEDLDNTPKDVATSLTIELPPDAVNTLPTNGLLGTLIKQALPTIAAPAAPPADATTQPVVVQLPAEKKETNLPAPKQPELAPPAKPAAKPAAPLKPKTPTTTDEDPFAVKNLFEPATTPVSAPAATSADPFAP
jgi:hypothetical protein